MLITLQNVILFLTILVLLGCEKKDDVFFIDKPDHFPEIPIPKRSSISAAKIALGKSLFFDKRLSRDSTISCASCHIPAYAFSDTLAVSLGVDNRKGKRNSPSLVNAAYQTLFNKDGGVTKLDIFALVPIEDHAEMDIPIGQLIERLSSDTSLQAEAQNAFDRDLDPFVITRALSSYVRTLISEGSKYDDHLNGKGGLTLAEERGRILFFSEQTNCTSCHSGILFTNQKFENNGTKVVFEDQGRKLVTGKETDRGKFKVPSLRNVAITAPYMHDGSFPDLASVITHYNSGGSQHVNQNPLIKPLHLSATDQQDLIIFLEALSDKNFTKN